MKTIFAKAGLALALTATALTAAVPAEAQRYNRGYRNHDNTGTVIVAGIAGLAIGAALASSNNRRDGYYEQDYYYDRGPAYVYDDSYQYRDYRPVYPRRYYEQRYYNQRDYYRYDDRGRHHGRGHRHHR